MDYKYEMGIKLFGLFFCTLCGFLIYRNTLALINGSTSVYLSIASILTTSLALVGYFTTKSILLLPFLILTIGCLVLSFFGFSIVQTGLAGIIIVGGMWRLIRKDELSKKHHK